MLVTSRRAVTEGQPVGLAFSVLKMVAGEIASRPCPVFAPGLAFAISIVARLSYSLIGPLSLGPLIR